MPSLPSEGEWCDRMPTKSHRFPEEPGHPRNAQNRLIWSRYWLTLLDYISIMFPLSQVLAAENCSNTQLCHRQTTDHASNFIHTLGPVEVGVVVLAAFRDGARHDIVNRVKISPCRSVHYSFLQIKLKHYQMKAFSWESLGTGPRKGRALLYIFRNPTHA